jgi:hypothetical protein
MPPNNLACISHIQWQVCRSPASVRHIQRNRVRAVLRASIQKNMIAIRINPATVRIPVRSLMLGLHWPQQ